MQQHLHVVEAGAPDGYPMLFVHGFLSSSVQWDLNRPALGDELRMVMVELFGHGASPAPEEVHSYDAEAHIAEFERIREQRNLGTWWVCGQSLGGAVAMHYCLAHPERVRGLVFTNSRAAFGLGRPGVSDPQPERTALTSVRDLPIHPMNAKRLDASLRDRMIEAADGMPLHAVEHYLSLRHTWNASERLSELSMPVLLVNGKWEKAFQPFVASAEAAVPNLRVVSLEGGHAINAERSAEFDLAVLEFVRSVESVVDPI